MLRKTVTTKTTYHISGIELDSILLTGIGIGICIGILITIAVVLIVH
jgi:hypothetical protein